MSLGVDKISVMTALGDVQISAPSVPISLLHRDFDYAAMRLLKRDGLRVDVRHPQLDSALGRSNPRMGPKLYYLCGELPSREAKGHKVLYLGAEDADDLLRVVDVVATALALVDSRTGMHVQALQIERGLLVENNLRTQLLSHLSASTSYPAPPVPTWVPKAGSLEEQFFRYLMAEVGESVSGLELRTKMEACQMIVTIWHDDPTLHNKLAGTVAPRLRVRMRELVPAVYEALVQVTPLTDPRRKKWVPGETDLDLAGRIAAKMKAQYG